MNQKTISKCKLDSCNNNCSIDLNGNYYDCCCKEHLLQYQENQNLKLLNKESTQKLNKKKKKTKKKKKKKKNRKRKFNPIK